MFKKKQEAKKKKNSSIWYYFIFFGIFVAISATLSMTEFFKIERVLVSGNNKYPPENIIATADIEIGTSIFALDTQRVKNALKEEYVYIEDVEIKREFPPTIILDIKQAKPIAEIENGENYALVSAKGIVLEEVEEENHSLPLIVGIGSSEQVQTLSATPNQEADASSALNEMADSIVSAAVPTLPQLMPGDEIMPDDKIKMEMVENLGEALEVTGFGDLDTIDTGNDLNLIIVYDNRLIIELGSAVDLDYKLSFIMQTSEYNNPNFSGVIDATISKQLRVRKADVSELLGEDFTVLTTQVDNLFDE